MSEQAGATTSFDNAQTELPVGLYPLEPKKNLADFHLPEEVLEPTEVLLHELRERDVLSSQGHRPRHALFVGPGAYEGDILAAAVAADAKVPIYLVRLREIVDGNAETVLPKLGAIIRHAAEAGAVLFFEGLVQLNSSSEHLRTLMLEQILRAPANVTCISATTDSKGLDKSVARVFEFRINVGLLNLPVGLYPLKVKKRLHQLRLPEEVQIAVDDFLTEQRERLVLAAGGLEPRHKALLMGPPGNGKTVLAGAISVELGVPAYMVRYDDLISNKPGETSRRLLALFTYAAQQNCLIFFDEFDALGRERDDNQESGEMKRVVSTLLVQLDDVPSNVVCIAATNHAQMLDAAIWRRFNIRIELPRPQLEQYPSFMREEFEGLGYTNIRFGQDRRTGEVDLEILSLRMSPENFSDAELFVRNCVRQFLLAKGRMTIEQSIWGELDKWSNGQKRQVA